MIKHMRQTLCVVILTAGTFLLVGCENYDPKTLGDSIGDSICREETRDRGPCPEDEDEARWRRL